MGKVPMFTQVLPPYDAQRGSFDYYLWFDHSYGLTGVVWAPNMDSIVPDRYSKEAEWIQEEESKLPVTVE